MNDDERETTDPEQNPASGSGVNLTLIYSLIALALVAAILVAMFIVLPFYQRR